MLVHMASMNRFLGCKKGTDGSVPYDPHEAGESGVGAAFYAWATRYAA